MGYIQCEIFILNAKRLIIRYACVSLSPLNAGYNVHVTLQTAHGEVRSGKINYLCFSGYSNLLCMNLLIIKRI